MGVLAFEMGGRHSPGPFARGETKTLILSLSKDEGRSRRASNRLARRPNKNAAAQIFKKVGRSARSFRRCLTLISHYGAAVKEFVPEPFLST
jgi:hypothetical protein